ncbi:MAG TPA: class I SAM-dependent methyltransferase [Burkholderiales bacterium]|nr:class I SAM-dependent methyltransferase [Burkholderiales bacterium]
MKWKQCTSCSHIFTEGYYTDEVCKLIYGKTSEHQQVGFDIEKQRIASSHVIEKVLPYASSGSWLDVGFGNASLLFTAQEYGFTPIGLEIRAENVNQLTLFGIECYCKDITELSLEEKCSVISMCDVLEHVPYPKRTLQAAHELLVPEGVMFISMPNIESHIWAALDQQEAHPYWGEIEHYHNFSRTRLYGLLREFGFEPVRYGISERYRACMEIVARKLKRH